jgi:hypothetical protein
MRLVGPLLVAVALAARPVAGASSLSVDEALALAFPGCAVERGTVYLTEAQRARATELAGEELPSAVVHPYLATRDGAPCGTGYFDTHRVRTLAETLLVAIDVEGAVARVEVVAFAEPPEYLPRAEWYEQFDGRALDPELALRRGIRPVAGATLTARATTAAARRALALHRVLAEAAAARAGESSTPP